MCSQFLLFFLYLDPWDQTNEMFQHLSWLSSSCKKKDQKHEGKASGRKTNRAHIIFLLCVTPWNVLAVPGLSTAPFTSIPPLSPTSSFSSSGFIRLRSLQFHSVEIRVKHKPACGGEKVRGSEGTGRRGQAETLKTKNAVWGSFLLAESVKEPGGKRRKQLTEFRLSHRWSEQQCKLRAHTCSRAVVWFNRMHMH